MANAPPRLSSLEVIESSLEHTGAVFEQPEGAIAVVAEDATNLAGSMVMVNGHETRDAFVSGLLGLSAYGALVILALKQLLVFFVGDAVLLTKPVLQSVHAFLLAVLGFPGACRCSRAVFANSLQPAGSTAILKELTLGLHRLTASAPLHTYRHGWSAAIPAIMADDIGERLPFYPTLLSAGAWCYGCFLAATTLTVARLRRCKFKLIHKTSNMVNVLTTTEGSIA